MRKLNLISRVSLASKSGRITLASILAALMTSIVVVPAAKASLIVWQTPVVVDTNNPAQVLTNGIVSVAADTITPYTVNGVSFSGNLDTLVTNFTNEGSPLGPSGTDYHKMLNSSIYRQTGVTANIHIASLTLGKLYEVQLFTPFWDNNFNTQFSDGANSVIMGNTGSIPTFVVGTFIADATTKDISLAAAPGSGFGLVSAIQVLAVPEPASLGLLAIGCLAMLKCRRACVAVASGSVRIALASILTAFLTSLAAAPAARAGLIVWQTPVLVNTTDPTQIVTNGIVLVAEDVQTTHTINGVTFSPTNFATDVTNLSGAVSEVYGPNNTTYANMLAGGAYRASGGTANIAISSLTIGKLYEVQIFTPFWDQNYQSKFSDGANSVLMGNTSTAPTFVVGTFTADVTTKNISFDAAPSSAFGLLSAFQVLAVPEPASLGLLAIGGVALIKRRR